MTGAITWEAVAYLCGIIVSLGVVVGWVFKLLAVRDAKIAEIEKEMKKVEDALHKHQLHAAEHFATKDGLSASLKSMQTSIDKLVSRVDGFLVTYARERSKGD